MIFKTDLLEAFIEGLPILVAEMTQTGAVLYANHQAEKLFGYTVSGSLKGMRVDDLAPMEKRAVHKANRGEYELKPYPILMGEAKVIEGCRKDGTVFPMKAVLWPKNMDGEDCVVAVILDLSDLPVETAHEH